MLPALMVLGQQLRIPTDTVIKTNHIVNINGNPVSYEAETGMQPWWDEKGEVKATLHYTYYRRTGKAADSKRPLLISFNGGPGSASAWMHLAYTGPKVLNMDEEGYPVQPYGFSDNPYSVLDVCDILYVNPANTGYSRTVPFSGKDVDRKRFFGVNADINYLSEWLSTFVSRKGRWASPKFLIGESYGGTRVSGLAMKLQERQWMYLNGVILVSPADYKIGASDVPLSTAINMPYMTAAAWHHQMLPEALQQQDLPEVLEQAEAFAMNEYLPALTKGGFIGDAEKSAMAERLAYFTGLSTKAVLSMNLAVTPSFFWKELLRDEGGFTVGRLDSRYLGIDKMEAGTRPDYNAELNSWLHTFTPAINQYMREELGFDTDIKYNMFGPVHPWDRSNNNTREELRRAMATNPYLNIMYQTGYYDGATTYFASKYSMMQLDPSGRMKDRMHFKGYRSGHMMYLRKEDLKTATSDLREFILNSLPDGPAKYERTPKGSRNISATPKR